MPSKHPAGGCGCCIDCDCTFELVGCVFSWECPTALNVKLLRLCSGIWYLIAEGAPTGSATVARNVEYKLEVYCETLDTPSQTYDLGTLTTNSSCTSDCITITAPTNCQCADSSTTKKTSLVASVTISNGAGSCTLCSNTVSGYDWSGTYDVDCGDILSLWKSTLIQAACTAPGFGGQDVYVIEWLEIRFLSNATPNSTGTYVQAVLTAQQYLGSDPCPGGPHPSGSAGTCVTGGTSINRCSLIGNNTETIDFSGCSNPNPCNSGSAAQRKCISSLALTTGCQQLPPFFITLCNYSSISGSATFS
jgi:hypothetical protein